MNGGSLQLVSVAIRHGMLCVKLMSFGTLVVDILMLLQR